MFHRYATATQLDKMKAQAGHQREFLAVRAQARGIFRKRMLNALILLPFSELERTAISRGYVIQRHIP